MELKNSTQVSADESRVVTMRLLELTRATNYELVQENGQRRMTAPDFTTDLKDKLKGAEVFLGRLPRDCYEDEIMPLLEKVAAGRVLELRLMLDFSGSTRGYAFALFDSPRAARQACRTLDACEIRPGHKIGVVKSIDNCRLFFGGVPKDKTKKDFTEELGKILDGIVDVLLYPDIQDRRQNRGFIFVEFKDHRSAAMARRKLIPGRVVLWNHEIAVDWADPEPCDPVDDDLMKSVTALFVRNLSVNAPHQEIKQVFQRATGVPVLKLKKINHFAFVHYENRQLAERAFDAITQPGGAATRQNWEVRWAKPISGSTRIQDRQNSINEAIKNNRGNRDGPPPTGQNQSDRSKKRSKKNKTDTAKLVSAVNFQRVLERYVVENLGAICRFECQWTIELGHVCKITVIGSGNQTIFAFQGCSKVSREEAVEKTSQEVYTRLHFAVLNYFPGAMLNNVESRDWPKPRKIEACR